MGKIGLKRPDLAERNKLAGLTGALRGENNPRYKHGNSIKELKICQTCRKKFIGYRSRKYCSKKCGGIGRENHILRTCPICNKTFTIFKANERIVNFCSRSCLGKSRIGEKNSYWKGGFGKFPYPFNFNKELKELIRKRDNYKCQLCGVPQVEHIIKFSVHHIDHNKNNLNPENLISLCRNCHGRVNAHPELLCEVNPVRDLKV